MVIIPSDISFFLSFLVFFSFGILKGTYGTLTLFLREEGKIYNSFFCGIMPKAGRLKRAQIFNSRRPKIISVLTYQNLSNK